MSDSKHVTYEDAGVDTAEGGRAVDAIKQMVKDTNRPEVIGGIGGFGGLFSAAAIKDMEDPILISGTDGVGHQARARPDHGPSRDGGLGPGRYVRQRHSGFGRRAAVLPGLRCHRSHRGRAHGKASSRVWPTAASSRAARSWAARWPSIRASWLRPTTTSPASPWASSIVPRCSTPRMSVLATSSWACLPPACTPTGYSLVRKVIGVDGIDPGTPEAAAKAEELSRPLEELGGASLADALAPRASTSSRFWSCCAVAPTFMPLPTSLAAVLPRTSTARSPTTSTLWSPATVPRWAGTFRPSSPTCRARPSSRPTRRARPSTWALACADCCP